MQCSAKSFQFDLYVLHLNLLIRILLYTCISVCKKWFHMYMRLTTTLYHVSFCNHRLNNTYHTIITYNVYRMVAVFPITNPRGLWGLRVYINSVYTFNNVIVMLHAYIMQPNKHVCNVMFLQLVIGNDLPYPPITASMAPQVLCCSHWLFYQPGKLHANVCNYMKTMGAMYTPVKPIKTPSKLHSGTCNQHR